MFVKGRKRWGDEEIFRRRGGGRSGTMKVFRESFESGMEGADMLQGGGFGFVGDGKFSEISKRRKKGFFARL